MSKRKSTLKCNSIRANPEMQFTTDDLCRLLFGMGKSAFVQDYKNDTSGKYGTVRNNEDREHKNL